MSPKTVWPTALALAISTCLLAACGGGTVRSPAITPAGIPPPPPSSAPAEPCPAPVTDNCSVDASHDQDFTGGRQSNYALIKRNTGRLTLIRQANVFGGPPFADYRFSGGTTIEAGTLRVASSASLHSNVTVQTDGGLVLGGAMTGDLVNHGSTYLYDTVFGNVFNDGSLEPAAYNGTELAIPARIEGNYKQPSNGSLYAVIGAVAGGYVTVTGRADIDGTLRLVAYSDDWGPYPLPTAPLSLKVLHADGGVFGKFAQWTSPGLFITGDIRYLPNDVFFDATAISAAATMAAARAGDALTANTASRFDAALGSVGGNAWTPGAKLTEAQRHFLASAASIQRIQSYDQAVRTFDSLSGYGHAAVADALLQQAALPAPGLGNRMAELHAGAKAGAWSATPGMSATGAGTFNDQYAGFDQWLGKRFLLGASVGWGNGSLHFAHAESYARDQAPQWDVYFRRNGAGDAYVLGDIGYSQHQLGVDRRIELGDYASNVHVMRNLDVTRAYVETGRDFRVLGGRLTPFAGLSHASLRAAGFAERGSSGFELVAQPSFHERVNAVAGLRIGRHWRVDDRRWVQLDLDAGYLQMLRARDDTMAAFSGTPDVSFALTGLQPTRTSNWQRMSLVAGGRNWAWTLSHDRQAGTESTSVGMQLKF